MPTAEQKNPSSLADRDPPPMLEAIPEYEYTELESPTAIAWLNSTDKFTNGVAVAINQKDRLRLKTGESVPLERVVKWLSWHKDERVWSEFHQAWGAIAGFTPEAAKVQLEGIGGVVQISYVSLYKKIPPKPTESVKERKQPDICKAFPVGTTIRDRNGNSGTVTKHLTATRIEISWQNGNPFHCTWEDVQELGIRKTKAAIHKPVETAAEIVPASQSEIDNVDAEIDSAIADLDEAETTYFNVSRAIVACYRRLGKALLIARQDPKKGGHGKWGNYLQEKRISDKRWQRARDIAEGWEILEAIAVSNQSDVTNFTLTEALEHLDSAKQLPAAKESKPSPEGRTFEEVQELFAPWGSFEKNPAGGAYKYILTGCRGGDRHFKGLDSAAKWHSEYCREDNRLDAPERERSETPVTGAASFAPPPPTQHSVSIPEQPISAAALDEIQTDEAVDSLISPKKSALPRVENDFYPTEAKLTEELLKIVEIDGQVFECCAGDGAIAELFTGFVANDPYPQNEFRPDFQLDATLSESWQQFEAAGGCDWVVTNPPFSLAPQILPLAFEYARVGVAFLLRLSYAEPCADRAEWLQQNADHLSNFIVLNPRPRFRDDTNGGDTVTVAWFVWRKDWSWSAQSIPCPFSFISGWR